MTLDVVCRPSDDFNLLREFIGAVADAMKGKNTLLGYAQKFH